MQNVSSSIVDMYQTQLEASRQFADAIFSGTEKIDRVMIDATHRAVTDQLQFAQALAGVRDQRSLANVQAGFLPKPESAVNYQKEILQVFAEMQNDIGKSIQQYVDQLNTAASATSRGTENVKRMADGALNPMTGMLSVWESAFREVAELANRNMQAARSSFETVAGAAGSAANQAVGAAATMMDVAEEEGAAHKRAKRK